MIDTNISESFTSAIDSKNNIKNSLVSLGVSVGKNDNFSTYGTKIIENLTLKSEVDKGKEKIATAITSKGVTSTSSDSFEEMAQKITNGLTSKSEVDEGKEKIATAITNKGITTNATDSLITMAENIDKIEQNGGGGGESAKKILEGTSEVLNNDSATLIQRYLFCNNLILTTVNLPNVTLIKADAFENCSKLNSISCPKLETLNHSAFNNFYGTTLDFPNLITAGGNNFSKTNANLKTFNFPKLRTIQSTKFCALPNGFEIPETLFFSELEETVNNNFYGTASTFKNSCKYIKFPKLQTATKTFFGGTSTNWNLLETVECDKLKWTATIIPAWINAASITKLKFSAWQYCKIGYWAQIIQLVNLKVLDLRNLLCMVKDTATGLNTLLTNISEAEASLENTQIETLYLGNAAPDNFGTDSSSSNKQRASNIYKNCSTLKYLIFQEDKNPERLTNFPPNIKAIVYLKDSGSVVTDSPDISSLPNDAYFYVIDSAYNRLSKTTLAPKLRKISEYKTLLENDYGLDLNIYPNDYDYA